MNGNFLEKVDPRSKLFFSITIIVLAVFLPDLKFLTGLIIITLITVALGHSLKRWLDYLSPFAWFLPILFVLNLFFYAGGESFLSLDLYLFSLSITYGGIMTSLTILLRLFAVAGVVALFIVTVEVDKFETSLTSLGVPWKLAFIFSLTLKLVPEMKERYKKIEEAQKARGLDLEGNPIKKAKKRIPMLIPFLASIIRYGFELKEALEAREFDAIEKRKSTVKLEQGKNDLFLYSFSIFIFSIYIILYFF